MTGATTAALIGGAAAVASAGLSYYSSSRQAKATKAAADAQTAASNKSLAQQQQAFNKQNQKTADIEGILEAASASDTGATLLTGASGVDKSQLSLGKGTNLLGG